MKITNIKTKSKDKSTKKIVIKNRTCYHFDDIIRIWDRDIDFSDILFHEKLHKNKKIFLFMTFQTKLQQEQNNRVSGSVT